MAKLKAPRTVSKRQELREDVVVTFSTKVVDFVQQYRTMFLYAAGAIVVIAAALTWYFVSQNSRNDQASAQLGKIVRLYESGLYQQALDGTGDNKGLRAIADDFGGTVSGNLARYYAGSALVAMGEREEALTYFEAFDKGNDIVGAAAYAATAAIYEDVKDDKRKAADLYERAGTVYPHEMTSPEYLRKAARNYEEVGELSKARKLYELIVARYPESGVATGIDLYLARLDMMEQKAAK